MTRQQIAEHDLQRLFSRPAFTADPVSLKQSVSGKRILVTGAGGSIGAELCRQIALLSPQQLVLLESSEHALHDVERELEGRPATHDTRFDIIALLGSVCDYDLMIRCLDVFGIDTVFHSAAFKHVSLIERNLVAGVANNVLGTWEAARAALSAGVERFCLISSDKAVNPASVLGATKRLSELALSALACGGESVRFYAVRFGNVLASSGSVVEIFREQIERGGPVTVTDPAATRYFISRGESAQMILQANAIATGGEIFVFDMGAPVRIIELARRMIELAGLRVRDENCPDGDVVIERIGMRSGEKLHEEIARRGELEQTPHPGIYRIRDGVKDPEKFRDTMGRLCDAVEMHDCDSIRRVLSETIPEYRPRRGPRDVLWQSTGSSSTD